MELSLRAIKQFCKSTDTRTAKIAQVINYYKDLERLSATAQSLNLYQLCTSNSWSNGIRIEANGTKIILQIVS